MYKNKYISKNVAQETYKKPINIFYKTSKKLYPHFIDFILEEATTRYGRNAVYNGGLRIFTSIDAQMQNFAQNIVTNEIASLKRYKVQNGASLVTKNKTGEILAMVGSKNYYDISIDGFVNLTTALRQPGSSIKPFNYSLAFNTWLSPTTILEDTPVTYSVKGSKPWSPKNYDNTYRGKVTASFALANSLNIPSVKVLNKNGIENFVEYVKKFGIDSWNNDYYGLSLALGAAEVQMTQMAGAYSTFANEGVFVPINPILYTLNNTGDVIDFNECIYSYLDFDKNNTNHSINKVKCGKEATSKENAYIIKSILSNNNLRSSAFGFNSVLNVAGTAVKTGTTNNLRDNWTFGFNNEYMVSSWVGNNDNTPMSSIASGITGASPIWAKIIKNVTKPSNYLDLTRIPSNMVKVEICAATNTLAC
ncbi:hypothetical protein KA001_02735, partial [Patescibacteria group bacterium]|nr:hypothetical protein [Patescibacteria group bacterium]